MKKIAIATESGFVSEHFGHCEGFTVYDIEGQNIKEKKFIENPGHSPGFLPNYLGDMGVETVISGGMGGGAIQIFNERNIQVITGVQGAIDRVVQGLLNGELQANQSVCDKHMHAGECGEHK